MTLEELEAYLSEVQDGFPEPLLAWMRVPLMDMNVALV